jgi:hypothetical protein
VIRGCWASAGLTVTLSAAGCLGPLDTLGYEDDVTDNQSLQGERDPTWTYAARTGTGDGLLMAHLGVELARASGRALLLEYTYARPILDDPGDSYTFTANHFFSIGFHSGGPAAPDLLSR